MSGRDCLGEQVSAYVDDTLSPPERLACERHLIACTFCRAEVDLERRMIATLKAGPAMSTDLMSVLISVSQEIPVRPAAESGRPRRAARSAAPAWLPQVPTAPAGIAFADGLRVLGPQAPAQHRSALRAAVFATAAAGASMAAVWAFTTAPTARTVPASAVPATPAAPAANPLVATPGTTLVVRIGAPMRSGQAESTP